MGTIMAGETVQFERNPYPAKCRIWRHLRRATAIIRINGGQGTAFQNNTMHIAIMQSVHFGYSYFAFVFWRERGDDEERFMLHALHTPFVTLSEHIIPSAILVNGRTQRDP